MGWLLGAVQLSENPASRMDAAVPTVAAQLESEVLPQLRDLRPNRVGNPASDWPIIPPPPL